MSPNAINFKSLEKGRVDIIRVFKVRYIFYYLMQREREKKPLIQKGVFISNERKKRQGGRIRCPLMENKIQVHGFNMALHESEVEWVEVRRYRKEKRDKKPVKEEKKGESKKKAEENQKNQKWTKHKSKNVETIEKNQEKQTEQEIKKKPQKVAKSGDKNPKKTKYKLKTDLSDKQKLEQNKSEQKFVKYVKDEVVEEDKKDNQQFIVTYQREQREEQPRQTQDEKKEEEIESESESEQQKDLQIIVGRVKRETNIIFRTKPFVAVMKFNRKKGKSNKRKKVIQDPMEQILEDFNVDVVPIHARLPVMSIDDLINDNIKILSNYAKDELNISKEVTNKQLNRVLDELENCYIFVTFSDWDGDFPLVRIHKILGKSLTINGQCQRFLYQHGLNDYQYQQKSNNNEKSLQIQPTPLHKVLDDRMVFTIDPPTSTDLDDALSIQKVGNNFEIGIHIADVSSYLHLIDRDQIAKRTTSVYLPYKVYHMLERQLVKICSLDPGVERLAFTVWVTLDLGGNVIGESRLEKHIVKSRFKLSYDVVQNIITGLLDYPQFNKQYPSRQDEFISLQQKLLNLTEISSAHRRQRILFDVFENQEMQFKKDQSNWPIECYIDKRYTAKKVVEEFMIIGNVESARFLVNNQPNNALVIHHPKPSNLSVKSFNQQFKMMEHKFVFENVLDVQKQLIVVDDNQKVKEEVKKLCFYRARRVMEPAIYRKYNEVMEDLKKKEEEKVNKKDYKEQKNKEVKQPPQVHFALGLQFYTHFTSPMRRMADILVHEVLTKILEKKQPQMISAEQVAKINLGRRSTKRLKKDLNEVYLCLMIYHTKKTIETQGIISSFGMQSVSIYIPLFDMQKEVLWKKEFKVHSLKRIRDRDDMFDVKLYHDPKTAKKDIYWVMKKFQKVKMILGCTKSTPLNLTVEMEVQSEKGPFKIQWVLN